MANKGWRAEAERARAERATRSSAIERIALDNARSKHFGVPLGLLVAALEREERELDDPDYIPPVLRGAR